MHLKLQRGCSWGICQPEKCPTTGTPHIQGLIGFTSPKAFSALKKALPAVHWEVPRSPRHCADYCQKSETREGETMKWGDIPKFKVGKRTDIDLVRQAVKARAPMAELYDEHYGTMLRYGRGVKDSMLYLQEGTDCPKRIEIVIGDAGIGKTKAVYDEYGYERVYKANDFKWFEGYDPNKHTVVLFDDYRGQIKWTELMNLTDRYPYRVQFKGGTLPWNPTAIIFTSNIPPSAWYPKKYADASLWAAFTRRVSLHKEWISGRWVVKVMDGQLYP